ncbi:hypothetical protein EDM00_11385 [Ornithobacterium rhinotracheale]|uniref:hypothetical protein n=1 Tax=Ornithobacterium rhinotracheale TaxID=28251 RepID=UPI00129D09EF|nr:hypothetical protein [Ornithobacterium rhinotracheale]MRI64582.1 hypothetical protein [Ornithobacterium rhinotracheale]
MNARRFSQQKLLRDYKIVFDNLQTQEIIKTEMAEYGYDDTEIAKGKALYDAANDLYLKGIKESQEKTTAYAVFEKSFEDLMEVYKTDRKKAKIIFKNEEDQLKVLRVKGGMPRRQAELLSIIEIFYTTLAENEGLKTRLNRLKIDNEHISSQLNKLTETNTAYANYTREKGESQDATKQKEQAIKALDEWIQEFYSIAKIALEDTPQLLESVAKFIRS